MSDNLPIHPEAKRFQDMDKVMKLYIEGYKVSEISKQLQMTRAEAEGHIEEWRKSAIGGQFLKDRVTELLALLDDHYSKIIKGIWETIEEIDLEIQDKGATPQLLSQRLAAYKLLADMEAKRVDVLQKAGLLDAAELGDELADMEKKQADLVAILREVSSKCEVCGPEIAIRLSQASGKVVPTYEHEGEFTE